MFADLLGSFVDKEKITHDTIQSTLEDVAEELGCNWDDFAIHIKPTNGNFNMKFYIFLQKKGETPKFIREITLKEILS